MTFANQWIRDQFPGKWVYPRSNSTGDGLYNFDDYTATATRIHVVGEVIFHRRARSSPRVARGATSTARRRRTTGRPAATR